MIFKHLFSIKYTSKILLSGMFVLFTSPALLAQYVNPPTAPKVVDKSAKSESGMQADPGMQIPVDGSSLEAFKESLAKIKEVATEANYITLEGAIEYLLVYDIGAGRDKAKVAKNLDGQTGEQILSQVDWRTKR